MSQPSKPRIPDIAELGLSEEQKRVFDRIRSGQRGTVEGPLRIWLHSPVLADRAQSLGAFCRYESSLPPDLSELAILVIAAHWRAGFEWYVHAPIAEAAGVSPSAIAAIKAGAEPEFAKPEQRIVFEFTSALVKSRGIPEALFEQATSRLGTVGTVDLVGVIGYYTFIAMTILAFDVAIPGDGTGGFDPV